MVDSINPNVSNQPDGSNYSSLIKGSEEAKNLMTLFKSSSNIEEYLKNAGYIDGVNNASKGAVRADDELKNYMVKCENDSFSIKKGNVQKKCFSRQKSIGLTSKEKSEKRRILRKQVKLLMGHEKRLKRRAINTLFYLSTYLPGVRKLTGRVYFRNHFKSRY